MKLKKLAALLAAAGISSPVFATNGMNMEGYGPVATGMGGASYAYDNGTAGLINNPATLALMASGSSRFDIAIGGLHPDVTSKMAGRPDAGSDGTAYYMPAAGYVRKDGKITWGVGMMAQGGMGTEYGSNSFLSGYQSAGYLLSGGMAGSQGVSGMENRSELGIGRVMLPLSYDVSDTLKIGGTIDYLWGGLDLQMVMPGAMFAGFSGFGGAAASPLGKAGGSMVAALGGFGLQDVNWAQFSFSEGDNKMKQRLTTTGWAGNLGFVWKATPALSIGGVYHGKTSLKDMEGDGAVNMSVVMGGAVAPMSVSGRLKIVDFQWPETYGIGASYQASNKLMLAADYKRIGWSGVMKNFQMKFTAGGNGGMLAGLNGAVMDATLYQNWDNQNVVMLGGSYKMSEALTLRAGVNLASNPIPDALMNPLFPAIVENHLALGVGYAFSKASSVDFALTHAPNVSATNSNMGVTSDHSQTNWQVMYSRRF
ncbi:MAG: outer membrane protein transport protein [Sterolibacterium sp.]|jgi:long-chain fatty acid transport protein